MFTDGACSNNGRDDSKAGFGVYFGEDDPRNVSEKIPDDAPQTNNYAELSAIVRAIELTKSP